jgi:hypothetical protein
MVEKLSKSYQKLLKKLLKSSSKAFGISFADRPKAKSENENSITRKIKKKKIMGIPRPGGNFVTPGKKGWRKAVVKHFP